MHSAVKRVLLRPVREIKCCRKISASAVSRQNEDFIVKSTLSDIVIPDLTFHDRLFRGAKGYLNHVAIESAETKKSYTYKQLQQCMGAFATSLHNKIGLSAGDIVAVMLPNSPEYPVVALGTMQAGCVLTTINPIYKEFEISHQVALTQPKLFITNPECYETAVEGLKAAKIQAKFVIIDNPQDPVPDGTIRYSELAEKGETDFALLSKIIRSRDDVAFIPFSSGTTGLPKGVEITFNNLMAGLEIVSHEKICYPRITTDKIQEVVPGILPFYHVYGFMPVLLGHLSVGAKLVTLNKFSASLYLDVLKNYKSTLLYVVPPIVIFLSKHPDVTWEHLKHVRHLGSGAAPLAASDVEPLLEMCKGQIQISQGFGATETVALTTGTLIGSKVDLSASGVPMSNIELMFVDPVTGAPVPVGQQGELYVRGPTTMKGYHKNEKATRESLTADGFYKTGDLGYFSQKDGLFISDRIKELIKVKGMQVAPAELESLLRSHPAVAEAAVIGVPHEIHGETPKAFIIQRNGATASEEDLQKFVAQKVASYKRIDEIQFVKDIPKTSSGKIMRRELKKMYA